MDDKGRKGCLLVLESIELSGWRTFYDMFNYKEAAKKYVSHKGQTSKELYTNTFLFDSYTNGKNIRKRSYAGVLLLENTSDDSSIESERSRIGLYEEAHIDCEKW